MDSWEFNKIAAALLSALLLIFGGKTMIDILGGGHGGQAKAGFTLPVTNVGPSTGGSDAKKGFDPAVVLAALPGAKPDIGADIFKKCKTCHTVEEGGKNSQGPNLWNIVNRDRAAVQGFSYSKALQEKGGKWDYESLAEFIHNPKKWLSGTKMAFAGIRGTEDLSHLLAYLRTLSASPAALPEAPKPTSAPATENKPAQGASDGAKAPAGGDTKAQPGTGGQSPGQSPAPPKSTQ